MVWRSQFPPRFLVQATFVPVGAQVGSRSLAARKVSRRTPEPVELTIQTSRLPLETRSKATRSPRGEKAGSAFDPRPTMRLRSVPSQSIV